MTVLRAQRGQAYLETLVVMPVLLFTILGALQVMLIAHAQTMTRYAAYCAARAGIVHNGNQNVMRNAGLIAALPLYDRTDDESHFLHAWARMKAVAEITQAVDSGVAGLEQYLQQRLEIASLEGSVPDISLIDIGIISPIETTSMKNWYEGQESSASSPSGRELHFPTNSRELDFDDIRFTSNSPESLRLVIVLRLLFPLRIPIVSKVLFELWMAQELLRVTRVRSSWSEWRQFRSRASGGRTQGGDLSEEVERGVGSAPGIINTGSAMFESQYREELRIIYLIAKNLNVYLVPLTSSYAMQMQSNFFMKNLRMPSWYTPPLTPNPTTSR